MWVSKKKWESLEKRIADLEVQVQGQQAFVQFFPEDSNGKHFENVSSRKVSSDS